MSPKLPSVSSEHQKESGIAKIVINNAQEEEFYRTVALTEVYHGKYYQKYSPEKQELILADMNRRITDSCRFNKEGQTVYSHINGMPNYISSSSALNLLNKAIDERIKLHTHETGIKTESKIERLEEKITQSNQLIN
jgi:hypothetical protein